MKISVNIKVRNPDWYWSEEKIQEPNKKAGTRYYHDWKIFNESKVPKHLPTISFDYNFNVESVLAP